jgi:hypothetical protein
MYSLFKTRKFSNEVINKNHRFYNNYSYSNNNPNHNNEDKYLFTLLIITYCTFYNFKSKK